LRILAEDHRKSKQRLDSKDYKNRSEDTNEFRKGIADCSVAARENVRVSSRTESTEGIRVAVSAVAVGSY